MYTCTAVRAYTYTYTHTHTWDIHTYTYTHQEDRPNAVAALVCVVGTCSSRRRSTEASNNSDSAVFFFQIVFTLQASWRPKTGGGLRRQGADSIRLQRLPGDLRKGMSSSEDAKDNAQASFIVHVAMTVVAFCLLMLVMTTGSSRLF